MFETQGGMRNRTRDLHKKGSAFILSSNHWTCCGACIKEKKKTAKHHARSGQAYGEHASGKRQVMQQGNLRPGGGEGGCGTLCKSALVPAAGT